jgi:hypothetical protein
MIGRSGEGREEGTVNTKASHFKSIFKMSRACFCSSGVLHKTYRDDDGDHVSLYKITT